VATGTNEDTLKVKMMMIMLWMKILGYTRRIGSCPHTSSTTRSIKLGPTKKIILVVLVDRVLTSLSTLANVMCLHLWHIS